MPEFSSSKIINHRLHVDNYKGELIIGYDMIIYREMMAQIDLTADLKRQVFQSDGTTVHMKDPIRSLGQSDLTKRNMRKAFMQTSEPASTRKATEILVEILDSIYAKEDLKEVANNASQLNAKERTLLLILLKDFEDLLDVTLCDWATELVNLYLRSDSKPFNSKYYLIPMINKKKNPKGA